MILTLALSLSKADASESPVKLSGTLVAGGDVVDFLWTTNSEKVVYQADQETDGTDELFASANASAAGNVKISGVMVAGGEVDTHDVTP